MRRGSRLRETSVRPILAMDPNKRARIRSVGPHQKARIRSESEKREGGGGVDPVAEISLIKSDRVRPSVRENAPRTRA